MGNQVIAKMTTARHFRSTAGARSDIEEGPFGVRRLAAAFPGRGRTGRPCPPRRSPTRTRLGATTRGETGPWEIDRGAPVPVHGRCGSGLREDVPRGTSPGTGEGLPGKAVASHVASARCSTWNVLGSWERHLGKKRRQAAALQKGVV